MIGAFVSAVAAGVLTFAGARKAVHLRGELTREVCAGGAWGMGAVLALTRDD